MDLSLEDAQRVLAAGLAQAESIGAAVSVAVVDARGDLVTLARMEGAGYAAAEIARGKAQAAAMFGLPSQAYQEMATAPIMQRINELSGGTVVFFQGGAPIKRDGVVIGGIGASGFASQPQYDEETSQAGADAL
jgi:glc operon protein GlcG